MNMTQPQTAEQEVRQLRTKLIASSEELRQLRIELTVAYDLIDSLQTEAQIVRQTFKDTLDDVIATCDALLAELKK